MMILLLLAPALSSVEGLAQEVDFKEDFEKGFERWEPTDPAAWRLEDGPTGKCLSQFAKSKYNPPQRSPFNIALLKEVVVGDFVLEAKCRSTVKDYPHRDLCVVFGYQDPGHFYYSHLGKKTDDHANQIFIVNGAPRAKISTKTTAGTNWTDAWTQVKVVRKGADIMVYWNDEAIHVQMAKDDTFKSGRIGVGSFDDTGLWDDVVLKGSKP